MSDFLSITKQHNHSREPNTSDVGRIGEAFASQLLQKNGYRLVLANFRVPIGRNRKGVAVTGEIDLIAIDGEVLCFIEVKTRSSNEFSSPLTAIGLRKQRQITRTAKVYRKIFGLQSMEFRFDAVSVLIDDRKTLEGEIVKGFWNENKFRKRFWGANFERF